jgi:hypothetical protein
MQQMRNTFQPENLKEINHLKGFGADEGTILNATLRNQLQGFGLDSDCSGKVPGRWLDLGNRAMDTGIRGCRGLLDHHFRSLA